jgi:hypothetical protein
VSSNRFGGRGATAGSRVQIRSAAQAESGTVIPAEQETGRSGQGQLFPHHIPDVDVGGALEQGVEIRIIRRLRVSAEDGGVHINVHCGTDIGQASPALALHLAMHTAPPQVFTVTSRLQLTGHRHWAYQMQIQTFERGIVGPKLSDRAHGTSLKVPNVDSQHSRLK